MYELKNINSFLGRLEMTTRTICYFVHTINYISAVNPKRILNSSRGIDHGVERGVLLTASLLTPSYSTDFYADFILEMKT